MKLAAKYLLSATVGAVLAVTSAAAQEWSEKPVTLVVPFKAGGISDLVAQTRAGSDQRTGSKHCCAERR